MSDVVDIGEIGVSTEDIFTMEVELLVYCTVIWYHYIRQVRAKLASQQISILFIT